jgi:Bifunctional DNA primase/polymerase, N-terminal
VTGDDGMLRAALAYVRIGWPVFPCRPGEKAPATRHGFLDASTDPGRIASWWEAAPGRNVAIATGTPGPDVLDVDVRPGGSGFAAFNRLKREGMTGRPAVIVRTPGGGMHAYYAGTTQRSGHLATRHIDFRSHGGYILAPPSTVNGRPYVVLTRQPSTDAFDWSQARELLDPQPRRQPGASQRPGRACDPGQLAAWVAAQPVGNRNAGLFWAASRAIEAGHADTLDRLARAAQAAGLTAAEASRTIRSAQRRAVSAAEPPAGASAGHGR